MFEYHGWVTPRSTAEAVDDASPLPLAEIEALLRTFRDEQGSFALARLDVFNGTYFVHFGGFRNHRQSSVIDLFAAIGRLAPGSYGLLHILDDEDPGHENEARVHRLVRGEVAEHTEELLSPTIPVLENPWSE